MSGVKGRSGIYKHHPHQGFQKGYTPWCKGTKGIVKPTSGSFKKGHKLPKEQIAKAIKTRKLLGLKGSKHYSWKGGQFKTEEGYCLVHSPNHPLAIKMGYVRRSHLIMEKHLGRYLTSKEVVHHINSIKDDDRIENLQLFVNKSEHTKHHRPKGIIGFFKGKHHSKKSRIKIGLGHLGKKYSRHKT